MANLTSLTPLTIDIKGTTYEVETFLACDTGNRVVRLTAKGKSYDVEATADRVVCGCPDWKFRHADLPGRSLCKHGAAVVAIGLLDNGSHVGQDATAALAV